jgi:hypothetical protein
MPSENIAQEALDANRRERAIKLRVRGAHWSEIRDACGYPSASAALRDVGEAMAEATMRAEETADSMRDTANLRLESLLKSTLSMLDQDAPVRYDDEGNELADDDRAVKLRAVDEARRIVESITKLNGVAAPKAEPDQDDSGIRIVGVRIEDIV